MTLSLATLGQVGRRDVGASALEMRDSIRLDGGRGLVAVSAQAIPRRRRSVVLAMAAGDKDARLVLATRHVQRRVAREEVRGADVELMDLHGPVIRLVRLAIEMEGCT